MPSDKNRLLLEIEKNIKEVNREVINPEIPELKLNDVMPVMRMVARARAAYLKALFELSAVTDNEMPSPDQIKQLRLLRVIYDELVSGAQALETAIQRGYLDVE